VTQNSCGICAELWEEYGILQRKASRAKIDSFTWALEEELNYFLDSVPGRLPADPQVRSKFLHNLTLNRTKKYSRRTKLLEQHQHTLAPERSPEHEALQNLSLVETTMRLRAAATPVEWRILYSLAQGDDYQTVAGREGISVTSLKSKVCRCRQRLKAIAA